VDEPAPASPEPAAEPPPEPEEPAPAEPAEPPPPPVEPVVAANDEELRPILFSAATDIHVLRRFLDREHGVGVYDPGESGVTHYCEADRLATSPGLGFLMGVDDRLSCDRRLTRCVLQGAADGYVFHFRRGEGDALVLDSLAHYPRRAPSSDSGPARAFARSGEGVCALYRAITDEGGSAPPKLSVFVASQTGLVPETLAEHRCGEEAAAAYAERIAPLGTPERCDRDPARCTFRSGDEEITVYGDGGAPVAVAITRHGMRRDLETAQQRDLDSFLRRVRGHECPAGGDAP
jgi:hypothetical protein